MNVDDEREYMARFSTTSIPTVVFFDKEGKKTWTNIGFMTEEKIISRLKELGVE